MSTAAAFAAGAAYGGGLWLVASRVARRRALALGTFPWWAIVACGSAAAGVDRLVPPGEVLLMGSTLVGAIVCALVDARTGFIFDALSALMVLVACSLGALTGRFVDGAIAALVVGGTLAGLYVLTGRRGIGLGDVKLGSAIALGYGLGTALISIGCAFVFGAVYGVGLILCGRAKRSDALRFGPFLAGGAAVGLTAAMKGWSP